MDLYKIKMHGHHIALFSPGGSVVDPRAWVHHARVHRKRMAGQKSQTPSPGPYSSMVVRSPGATPNSRALRTRRRILPDRVLGNEVANSSSDGVAIGPNS